MDGRLSAFLGMWGPDIVLAVAGAWLFCEAGRGECRPCAGQARPSREAPPLRRRAVSSPPRRPSRRSGPPASAPLSAFPASSTGMSRGNSWPSWPSSSRPSPPRPSWSPSSKAWTTPSSAASRSDSCVRYVWFKLPGVPGLPPARGRPDGGPPRARLPGPDERGHGHEGQRHQRLPDGPAGPRPRGGRGRPGLPRPGARRAGLPRQGRGGLERRSTTCRPAATAISTATGSSAGSGDRIYHYDYFEPGSSTFSRLSVFDIDAGRWALVRRVFAEKATFEGNDLVYRRRLDQGFHDRPGPALSSARPSGRLDAAGDKERLPRALEGAPADDPRRAAALHGRGPGPWAFRPSGSGPSWPRRSPCRSSAWSWPCWPSPSASGWAGRGPSSASVSAWSSPWPIGGRSRVFRSLGVAGALTPFLGAWGANLLFGLAGDRRPAQAADIKNRGSNLTPISREMGH